MEGEEVVTQDVPAESSSADGQPTPPAAPQPGTPGAPQSPAAQQTVPYERFNQVIRQNQQFRESNAQLQGRIQQMEALSQKSQSQGGQLSPADQKTYQEAYGAIEQILMTSERGRKLLQMADQADQFQGMQSTTKQVQEAQLRSLEQQGVQRILKFADDEQLPKDQEARGVFVKLVEAMAVTIPNYRERFAQGDLTLLDEAFEKAKPFLAHIKREGQTQLLDTKNRTRGLPPAPRGSAAGPPGLPKLDPDNPRAYTEALHKAAAAYTGSA